MSITETIFKIAFSLPAILAAQQGRRCGPSAISLGGIAVGVQRGFPLWLNRDFNEVRINLWALKKPMQEKLINGGY
jgi:hypothetical protein